MVESVCTGLKSGNLGIIMGFGCCVIFFAVILGVGLFFFGGGVLFFFLTNLKMFVHLRHEKDVFTPVA